MATFWAPAKSGREATARTRTALPLQLPVHAVRRLGWAIVRISPKARCSPYTRKLGGGGGERRTAFTHVNARQGIFNIARQKYLNPPDVLTRAQRRARQWVGGEHAPDAACGMRCKVAYPALVCPSQRKVCARFLKISKSNIWKALKIPHIFGKKIKVRPCGTHLVGENPP